MFSHEVYIKIKTIRGICKRCDDHPTTTQTLSWFDHNGHHTKPYDDYLMLQLIGSTQSDVAKKEGLTEEILQGVVDRYQIDEVDWKTISRISLLGIDEIAKKKGHQDYVTLVTSRYNGINKILGVLPGKEKSTIKGFLNTIPKKKRKTITAVCVDLCETYINAMRLAPLFELSPSIKAAYRLAQEFTHIYNAHHRQATAQNKLKAWVEKVEESEVTCFNTFAKTVTKYVEPISHYFIARDTSGWVEGINNKVKVIKRRCYGLLNLKHFFQRIFLDLQERELDSPFSCINSGTAGIAVNSFIYRRVGFTRRCLLLISEVIEKPLSPEYD